jgi:hypothetical protein
VELPSPAVLFASPPSVAPRPAVGAGAVVDAAGLVAPNPPLGKREGAVVLVVAAPELAGVVFAPKKLGAAVEAGAAPVLAVAGVAPEAEDDAGAGAAGFPKPKPPPVLAVEAVPGAGPGVDDAGFGMLKLRPLPPGGAPPALAAAPV